MYSGETPFAESFFWKRLTKGLSRILSVKKRYSIYFEPLLMNQTANIAEHPPARVVTPGLSPRMTAEKTSAHSGTTNMNELARLAPILFAERK